MNMPSNKHLHKAQTSKQDEFYTQFEDIEKELKHYQKHFKNQTVYCNCDNKKSNFAKYFKRNFESLKLKNLIVSDSDFREIESIEKLEQSDIVVTNPPFSLFREYVAQLIKYKKKFVILGNQFVLGYKEMFPLIQNNKMWLGHNAGDMKFKVPDYYEPRKTRYWKDEHGQKWRSLGNTCWFTNLDIEKRHESLTLCKKYNKEEYPKYDNYDAINVNKVKDIPYDYDGVMGVPITFLLKYNPEQFKIIKFRKGDDDKDLSIKGKTAYTRILITITQQYLMRKDIIKRRLSKSCQA